MFISLRSKYTTIIIIFILSIIYALPNLYGEDQAIIIQHKKIITNDFISSLHKNLDSNNITYKSIKLKDNNNIIIRFSSTTKQFDCLEKLKSDLDKDTTFSLNILAAEKSLPLEKIGAHPMKLGLDLRGGIHLLIKVHTKNSISNITKLTKNKIKQIFRKNKIRYKKICLDNHKKISINFKTEKDAKLGANIIKEKIEDFDTHYKKNNIHIIMILNNKNNELLKNNIIEKTITILNKRINELGISDSIIQKQGKNKIIIELPGIQDISRAKNILGKTATLNFMMIDTKNSITQALKGRTPTKSKLYYDQKKNPFLVKKKSILNGDSIIYASSGFEEQFNKPCINIKLGGNNIKLFEQTTIKNIGKPMAIIYKETFFTEKIINNKKIKHEQTHEKIISVATIMNALSTNFQITGLNIQETKDLALLLRSGSLPTTISIIKEKIIGPSLGSDNIKHGILSISIAFAIILIFMSLYYKTFGLIANAALITNLILLIALMSIIKVTLTLPGLAGIVLTIGMSIDANILIFERIKEEFKINFNIKDTIEKGFKNAFTSIIDSNFTTLLIGLILFTLGEGPIRGFAITLSIGIITSMYSAMFVTKTLIQVLLKNNIILTIKK